MYPSYLQAIQIAGSDGSNSSSSISGSKQVHQDRHRKGSYQSIPISDLRGASVTKIQRGGGKNHHAMFDLQDDEEEEEDDHEDGGYGSVISL